MAAAYLYFNYNCILACEISFSNTLYSIYCLNQPLWKIHGIAYINFDCFAIDRSDQVKISRVIMRCEGYFFKIALGARMTDLLIFSMPFLVKPLDRVIIHLVKLSGGDLSAAFTS